MPFLAARALRRRTAWNLVQIQQVFLLLMMYTKLMPFLILLLTCCSFLVALTWDMIWGAELFREWVFWLYGHWEDSCNQPIGPLQRGFGSFCGWKSLCSLHGPNGMRKVQVVEWGRFFAMSWVHWLWCSTWGGQLWLSFVCGIPRIAAKSCSKAAGCCWCRTFCKSWWLFSV